MAKYNIPEPGVEGTVETARYPLAGKDNAKVQIKIVNFDRNSGVRAFECLCVVSDYVCAFVCVWSRSHAISTSDDRLSPGGDQFGVDAIVEGPLSRYGVPRTLRVAPRWQAVR